MQFDIWIPQHSIAIDYIPKPQNIPSMYEFLLQDSFKISCFRRNGTNSIANDQLRNAEKLAACVEERIRLVHVPYWWDLKKSSFAAIISQACCHLIFQIVKIDIFVWCRTALN
jgi:hypothetical protein